jgi:kynureninase
VAHCRSNANNDAVTEREAAEKLDADDALASFRDRFVRPSDDVIYLDGNSLGMLPHATRDRLRDVVEKQWGHELVRAWQHWLDLPTTVGDRVGSLIGAAPGQVVVCDSISVNLFKLAWAALEAQPGRKVLVTDSGNFPSDRYVLAGAAERRKGQLRVVPTDPIYGVSADRVGTYLADDVAMVAFSHIDYRSGAIADAQQLTDQAHAAGALVLWDLSHSAGAVPVDLDAIGADLAVGCTYKYLNAGPGAPGFLYVRRDLQNRLRNPIQGWWSARDMFDMDASYEPASGIGRFLTGTPPVPGLVAVDEGAALVAEAGVASLRAKGVQLTDYLIKLSDTWLTPLGFNVASPRDPQKRGNHVVLAHQDAFRISVACAQSGVIGDARPPNLLRLSPTPLSSSFVDVWEGMSRIRDVVASQAYLAIPEQRSRVT